MNGRTTLPFFKRNGYNKPEPERTRSYEIGAELKFFKDKLGVNLTYTNATTYDQVFQIQAPAVRRASNFYINGGTIRNKGLEAVVTYKADFGGVSWSPSVNFSRNINQIRELSSLLKSDWFVLQSGGNTRMLQLFLTRPGIANLGGREYGSYGDLFGKTYQRDDKGNIKYNEQTGFHCFPAEQISTLGNANPKFLIGFNTSLSTKT